MGSGASSTVFSGPDGTLLVDAGIAVSRRTITDALAKLGTSGFQYLVNTYWHFDHTDGNKWVHSMGATIVAHENTRRRMSTATRVDSLELHLSPSPAGALPTVLFADDHTLDFNGMRIPMEYYGPAHTDGDISVTFTEADVMSVGDTWWNGVYPFIDYSTGGCIGGTIKATEANLAKATPRPSSSPGMVRPGDRSQMVEYRDTLVTVRDRVAALKK